MPFTALPVATPFAASDPDLLTELCGALEERVQWLGADVLDDYRDYQANWWSLDPFATYPVEEFPTVDPEVGDLWFFAGWGQALTSNRVVAPSLTPPASPSEDYPYLVGKSAVDEAGEQLATGAWEGHDGQQALWQDVRQVWVFAGMVGLLPVIPVSSDYDYYRWVTDEWVVFRMDWELDADRRELYRYTGSKWVRYADPVQYEDGGNGKVFRVGDVLWTVSPFQASQGRTDVPCYPISLWRFPAEIFGNLDSEIAKSVYQMQRQIELLMRWFVRTDMPQSGYIDGVFLPVWDPDSLWTAAGVETETSRHVWGSRTTPNTFTPEGFVAPVYIVLPSASGAWAGHDGEIATWDGVEWQFDTTTEWAYLYFPGSDDTPAWYERTVEEAVVSWDLAQIQDCGWTRKRWREITDQASDEGEAGQRAVLWHGGNCVFQSEYFLHDGADWVRAVDQQSPPDIVTSAGTTRPGDLVTPELVNELRAVLVQMVRIRYFADVWSTANFPLIEFVTREADFSEDVFPADAITSKQWWYSSDLLDFRFEQTETSTWPFFAEFEVVDSSGGAFAMMDFSEPGGFEYV